MVDMVIDSSHVGMRKPEARIYEYACDRLGVAPAATVFLDDMEPNVVGARAVGLTAIHVVDPAEAIAEVRRAVGLA